MGPQTAPPAVHRFNVLRGDTLMAFVIQETPTSGWQPWVDYAGGVFGPGFLYASKDVATSFAATLWYRTRPRCTSIAPIPPIAPTADTTYTATRLPAGFPIGAITAYSITQKGVGVIGMVVQAPAGKWTAYLPDGRALVPVYTTLTAGAKRLVAEHNAAPPVVIPPVVVPVVHDTVRVHDTVTVTHLVVRVDTVRIVLPTPGMPCKDSLMGPFLTSDDPYSPVNQAVETACGAYLGQVYKRTLATGDTDWVAVPWLGIKQWRTFPSARQAMLSLEGREAEYGVKVATPMYTRMMDRMIAKARASDHLVRPDTMWFLPGGVVKCAGPRYVAPPSCVEKNSLKRGPLRVAKPKGSLKPKAPR